ncbi:MULTISPECIES: hypothetical protein [unclassified Spirosoma]|uniref:hypothetical protein n=1 Tax=unclassified Spirosoma TaxID=2621999 RepID=UPI00095F2453|nr:MULTISPECIES: hypothetical protein [unclassified Spirosoma]MBN8827068.1 hypothetical protein [Spirosoma sp.]OJW76353.1 MAG: hypothetical protein BGO59_22805 [Spirosoma sp. 48-14]
MSLQIRIDGQVVDLTPDTKVNLELVNPYLVYEDILSAKATIPAIPATSRNRIIMGFPDLLQNDAVGMRYQCEKYYNGQLLQSGVAILTEAAQTFALTVVQPLGELFGDLHTKTLPEVDFGAIALPGALTPVLQQFGRNVVAFPTVLNSEYYGTSGASIGYSGKVNAYAGGAYTAGPLVPMVFLNEILLRVSELTGVTITGPFIDHPVLSQLLLYNTRSLDGNPFITLQQHLPTLTIPELLLELRKLFNLAMTVDTVERSIRLDFTEGFHQRAAQINWSDKALKDFKKRPETARRLQLGSLADGGDGLAKDKPGILADYLTPELESDTGVSQLSCKFSTLLTDDATGLAITKQAGITAQFGQLTNTFTPRLLFWNGLQYGIPTATARRGGYSLYWNGENGLAVRFWGKTEANRKRQFYLERGLALNEVDLATLDFSEKVHINGLDYWVGKLSINLPITEPAMALLVRA